MSAGGRSAGARPGYEPQLRAASLELPAVGAFAPDTLAGARHAMNAGAETFSLASDARSVGATPEDASGEIFYLYPGRAAPPVDADDAGAPLTPDTLAEVGSAEHACRLLVRPNSHADDAAFALPPDTMVLLRPRKPASSWPAASPTTPGPRPRCCPYTAANSLVEDLPTTPILPSPRTPWPSLLRPRTPALSPAACPCTPWSVEDVPKTPISPSPRTPCPLVDTPRILIGERAGDRPSRILD